eukprot:scaffold7381_cov310-Pinguiococcus_pyrenoidosus.AAC.6
MNPVPARCLAPRVRDHLGLGLAHNDTLPTHKLVWPCFAAVVAKQVKHCLVVPAVSADEDVRCGKRGPTRRRIVQQPPRRRALVGERRNDVDVGKLRVGDVRTDNELFRVLRLAAGGLPLPSIVRETLTCTTGPSGMSSAISLARRMPRKSSSMVRGT